MQPTNPRTYFVATRKGGDAAWTICACQSKGVRDNALARGVLECEVRALTPDEHAAATKLNPATLPVIGLDVQP